jgi:hypothetical protein
MGWLVVSTRTAFDGWDGEDLTAFGEFVSLLFFVMLSRCGAFMIDWYHKVSQQLPRMT